MGRCGTLAGDDPLHVVRRDLEHAADRLLGRQRVQAYRVAAWGRLVGGGPFGSFCMAGL
jgi:hypothetical protein